jgi:hypothetical protein
MVKASKIALKNPLIKHLGESLGVNGWVERVWVGYLRRL